jgi:hypothetical protein
MFARGKMESENKRTSKLLFDLTKDKLFIIHHHKKKKKKEETRFPLNQEFRCELFFLFLFILVERWVREVKKEICCYSTRSY